MCYFSASRHLGDNFWYEMQESSLRELERVHLEFMDHSVQLFSSKMVVSLCTDHEKSVGIQKWRENRLLILAPCGTTLRI